MKRLSWLYVLLIFIGCTESSIEDNFVTGAGGEEFYVSLEGANSRSYVDEQIRMRWHAEDRITIFKKETYNREFKFTGKTGANAGGFTQVSVDDDFYFGYTVNANYAVYPHSTDTELDETDCFFTLTMPAEQSYAEKTFGQNANTMVAVSETGNLMFKNVGCYLRVRLYGENTNISSVTLTTKGDEAIAGEAKVTPSMDGNPTCEMIGTGKSIRLICETPVAISSNADAPTDFWIVVPPVTLADGFSVTVKDENDNAQVYDVNQSFTFERNKYYDMVREVEIEDIKTVHVATAGTLPTLISEDEKYGITSLKITGDLNGTDFKLIREMAGYDFNNNITEGKLVYLDLSDANIMEGGEAYYDDGESGCFTKNNTLSMYMFAFFPLRKIVIPNSTTTIETGAFVASTIKSITIPQNVTKISSQPFPLNTLTEIIVDPENTVYDSRDNCNAIIETETNTLIVGCETSVIPNSVTSIGEYAFGTCTSLTSITIPNSVTSIGCSAFSSCPSLTFVTIGNGVTSIDTSAFSGCSSLTSVYISDLLAWCKIDFGNYSNPLGNGAKLYLKGNLLTELVIPEDVEEIKVLAFYNYSTLTSVTIGDGVASIGNSAFMGCTALTSVTIGDGVTSIDSFVFNECSSLTDFYCYATTPPTCGYNVFHNSNNSATLFVPKGCKSAYELAEGWSNFSSIIEMN